MLASNCQKFLKNSRAVTVAVKEAITSLSSESQHLNKCFSNYGLKLPFRAQASVLRYHSTSPMAAYDQTVDEFPSIIIRANELIAKGPFAEAQAHVSDFIHDPTITMYFKSSFDENNLTHMTIYLVFETR